MSGMSSPLSFRNIFFPALLLAGLGLMNIYSAGRNTSLEFLWVKHAIWLGISFGLAILVRQREGGNAFHWSIPLYFLSLIGLILVLLVGKKIGGSTRWFSLGFLGTFQPSELSKWITLLLVSHIWGQYQPDRTPKYLTILFSATILVPMVFIFLQPDLGMAVSFLPIFILILLIKEFRFKSIAIAMILLSLAGAGGWKHVLKPYQKERVMTFLNPSKDLKGPGYQINQSRIAIGNGGLWGHGIGGGTQTQLNFIPVKTTDFVFSVWAEEHGYIGVCVVLTLFGLLITRMLDIGVRARTLEESYFAIGAACIFSLHFFVNVGMVIGALPNKGMALPFFSYGGSSTLAFCLVLGLLGGIQHRGVSKS